MISQSQSDSTDTCLVKFTKNPQQKFGFDSYNSKFPQIKNNYKTLNLNNEYTVPWKSVQSFSTDKVNFTASAEDVYFKTETGVPIPAIGTTIQVRGSSAENETAVYAYRMEADSSEKIVGKLNVISYDLQPKTLIPVSVNGATVPTDLQFALNNIYKQAVTNWQVLPKQSITIEFEDGNFNHGGSGFAKTYNKDQSHVIETFLEGKSKDDKACYLFFINNVKFESKNIAGYMPLQRQFGFIYNNPPSNIIAHELGHGAFNLRHTFSDKYNIPEGSTDNLMDYSNSENATRLWKEQWDQVQDPDFVFLAGLQKEKEGEYKTDDGTLHLKILQEIRCAYLNNSEKIDISSYTDRYSSVKGKDIYMLTNHFRATSILKKLGLKELYFEKNTPNKNIDISKITTVNEGTIFTEFRGAHANKYHKFSHHIDIGNLKIYSNDINSLIKYLTPAPSDLKKELLNTLNKVGGDNVTEKDITQLKQIAACGSQLMSVAAKLEFIEILLNKIWVNEYNEDLILDFISTTPTEKTDSLLDGFLDKKLFNKLYTSMDEKTWFTNENNQTRLRNLLYLKWRSSKYNNVALSQYNYVKEGSKFISPYLLATKEKLKEWSIEFNIKSAIDSDNQISGTISSNDGFYFGMHTTNFAPDKVLKLKYHALQPVKVADIGANGGLQLLDADVPVFYLMSLKNDENIEECLRELSLISDIALTFTGVGNITKVKHLSRFYQTTKYIIAGVEIGSGLFDAIVRNTNIIQDQDLRQELLFYNSLLQIATLSGDVFVNKLIKKSAKKIASKNIDELDDEVKEIVKKHAGDVNQVENISKSGKIDKLFNDIIDHPDFQGFRNLYKNNPEISIKLADNNWFNLVNEIKQKYGIGRKRNIAIIEFDGNTYLIASGKGYNGQMRNSGKFIPEEFVLEIEKGNRIFEPTIKTRHLDTESIGLEYFAKNTKLKLEKNTQI